MENDLNKWFLRNGKMQKRIKLANEKKFEIFYKKTKQ